MSSARRAAVLIVEDERIVAMDLQQTLADMGYDAFAIAASGEEALLRAAEHRPDLVLMDIRIEGPRDGIQTAEILRERFRVPIVFLTAHADQAMIDRAKITEPHGYLLKPVQDAELRSAVSIALYKGEAEAARERAARFETQNRVWEQSSRLKDRFLGNMSHELRTPLNGLIGFAELMHDGLAGPLTDKQREFLGHVLTSGRRFLRVITDVLDLAGLESGQLAMHCSGVDLAALLDEVVASLRPALAAKAQRLSVEVEPACAHVVNDPAMLKQLAYHFLSNAIKFTPVRGSVSVRAMAQSADRFRIEVADTGIGIGPQNLERLFMPFEQLESGAGKPVEGAGVGLALSKRIAEAQGGRVGVDSKPGEGSVFFAVLPRVVPTVA